MPELVTDFGLDGVAHLLRDKALAVPPYQRSYSWAEAELSDFWGDLSGAFAQNQQQYFLGTIILSSQGEQGRLQVIDGQQRLATTSILLSVIRDMFEAKADTERATGVQNDFLSRLEYQSGQRIPKLVLNTDDDGFYRKLIIAPQAVVPTSDSHRLLLNARDYLRTKVQAVVDNAAAAWPTKLSEWLSFLETKVLIIRVQVGSESDAFLVFETLNDRGADLTIADLLKNYLFGRAGDRLDAVRTGWAQMLGALEVSVDNATVVGFLKHYWSSVVGPVRDRELYKSIKDGVATQQQAVAFIETLRDEVKNYVALMNGDHEFWTTLGTGGKERITRLLRFGLEQYRPLMLAAMKHFSVGELKTLVGALVCWSVRGLISGGIGGGLMERLYCEGAAKIRKGELQDVNAVFAHLGNAVPADANFEAAFASARITKGSMARYLLISLERKLLAETEPQFVPNDNEEQVNLEHVLPKTPTEADWPQFATREERTEFAHRIGNMCLLQRGPNGKLGNKKFADKKATLAASSFSMTKLVGAAPDWTKDEITKRQALLAKTAVVCWPRQP